MLIGYDTFPHIDMRNRGNEAALHLCEIIKSRKRPEKYFNKLPILTVPQMQSTNESPMKEIMKSVFNSGTKFFILVCMFLSTSVLLAQQKTVVTGVVKSADGPIQGATVTVKNTFNEEFTSGQKIKIKIIKVTDKGPQLKLQE